ncbi:hypothetical protein D3C81_851100 [compost metagenome]
MVAGVQRHQVLVGDDHLAKQAVDEQRARLAVAAGRWLVVLQREALADPLGMAARLRLVGVQRAGEVETAQQFGVLVGVGAQQAVDELLQAWFERRQLQREAVGRVVLAGDLDVLQHQLLARHLLPVTDQFIHRLAEALSPIGLFIALVREGLAHHFTTGAVIELAVEGGEAGDQVAFGEHQVDRQAHFQQRAAFLDAFAQTLGQALLVLG